ncbi:unnamed protein product [Camellia sinensis]
MNAEATVRRQTYTPVVPKSPRLEITPITQGAPKRMLLAVPKRKLLAVPKVTGVMKKVILLQKAESLRKITEDYVKASKQYAIVRAIARTKNFLIQAKEASQFATTTFVAASMGATKNVVAQLLKSVEDSIKMVESAQKKASVENMAIIRAIGRRVMTQTPVDGKKAPVVEKTVATNEPIVLFRAQNRSNQISVNSQEPKEHSLARQGSNEKHPLARQNKEHPLARQGSNKEHLLTQRDLNQHQLTRSKNVWTVLKIHEEFTKAQTVPSMPLGARLDMSSGPVSKRQRRRRNKALKKLELRTVATNVIRAIERALSKNEPKKQIESPVFVRESKVEEGKQPLGNISTLVELSMEGIRKGPVTRSITRRAQNKASQSDASNMSNVVGVDNPLYEQDDSISFVSMNIGNNELKDINKVAVMMTEVEKEGENSQVQQDQGLKEKVVALQEQLERREREMAAMLEQMQQLQAQMTGPGSAPKQMTQPVVGTSVGIQSTLAPGGNGPCYSDLTSGGMNLLLMAMIDDMVRRQVKKVKEKDDENFRIITKPYPAWVDAVPFPSGFFQPDFKMFDGTGDPRQHVAHFLSRCGPIAQNEALCLQLFVQSLESSAFTWYANLPEGSIINWDSMVKEFLKQFCNTQRRVGVPELIETKQRDNESVTDFIARWRALTFACPQKFTQLELIRMCLNNFRHELSTALMAQTFEGFNDLCTKAHDMELHLAKRRRPRAVERVESSTAATIETRKKGPVVVGAKKPKEFKKVTMKERLEKNILSWMIWSKTYLKICWSKKCFVLKDKIQELLDSKIIELPPQEKASANPITIDNDNEGEWVVYQSKSMKKKQNATVKARSVVDSTTQGPKVSKKQKPKVSRKQKKAKVSKRKGKKSPKKEKGEKLVPDEQLEQGPLVPVTLEEFLPSKFQSVELQTYFDKRREEKFTLAPCLTIIVLSDDEEDEGEVGSKVREGDCITSPICIPDSPEYTPTSPEYTLASPEYTPAFPENTTEAFSPKYSPVPPMYYQSTPEYVRGQNKETPGDDKVNGGCMSDDEVWKHSSKQAKSSQVEDPNEDWELDFSPDGSPYTSPARTYDGESVSSDHFDFPCNVITVDVNFEEREIHIIRNPGDDDKAKIEARRETEHQAKVTVSLKDEGFEAHQNLSIERNQISGHPFPNWVEWVQFSRGYAVPHFSLYNGTGCPRRHLVRFLAQCGNTVKSQALLLRQFVLSLEGWAVDWYFSLPPNSIPDWDTMADRFYRTFYKPWPIEIEMSEHLDDEGCKIN